MRIKDRFQNVPKYCLPSTASMAAMKTEPIPFRCQVTPEILTIYIHDVIGDPFEDLDSGSLVPIIHQSPGIPIHLDINSPGGFVFDAISVYNALIQHDSRVTADISGKAASAATILASAADHVRIATSAEYMVHSAWTIAMGNAANFEGLAKDLRAVDREIADLLATRSGMEVTEVADLMIGGDGQDGTSFMGREAVEKGFADEVIPLKTKPKTDAVEDVKLRYAQAIVAQRKMRSGKNH